MKYKKEIKSICEEIKKIIDESTEPCKSCKGSGIAFFVAGCPYPCTVCDGQGYVLTDEAEEW